MRKPFAFVVMPFRSEFDDVYEIGIRGAASAAGVDAERLDDQMFTESMLDQPTGVTMIKNNLSGTSVAMAAFSGTLSDQRSCIIRDNIGAGVNPPALAQFTAPNLALNSLIENETPFDCMVFISGTGTCTVFVSDAAGNLFSTGLGAGVAFLVSSGSFIEIVTVDEPTLLWAWSPQ
jgi:hypothetical protein